MKQIKLLKHFWLKLIHVRHAIYCTPIFIQICTMGCACHPLHLIRPAGPPKTPKHLIGALSSYSSTGSEGGSKCCFCKHNTCVPLVILSSKFKSSRPLWIKVSLPIHLPVCLQSIILRIHQLILLDIVHEDREPQLGSKATLPDYLGKLYFS